MEYNAFLVTRVYIVPVPFASMAVRDRVVSRRALRALQRPDSFVKYVLVRADVAGFPVSPARVKDIAEVLAAVPPESLEANGVDPIKYYRNIFAAYLAQDDESYEAFKKFWDDLWYVTYGGGGGAGGGGSGLDRLAGKIVDDLVKRIAGGVYSLPPEVIEE